MKKIYFMLLLLAAQLTSYAAPISQEQAHRIALDFFTRSATRTAIQLDMVWNGETGSTRTASEPAFYVFNRTDNAGFVIVAGDEVATPILGYSHQHNFRSEAMPTNLRYWLEGVRSTILTARNAGCVANRSMEAKNATTVNLLETALWDQIAPYNGECPYLSNGVQTITGCVATAASIVCKYYGWPTSMSGTTTAYTTSTHGITVPSRTLGSYDYNLMPHQYTNYTAAQAAEVARLMADIGALIKADYGIGSQGDGGTGAYTQDLLIALQTTMQYSKSSSLISRSSRSDAEWIAMLKAELDAGRPVLYAGSGNAGAHQFICDGYDTADFFHFNWGWSGSANGYYSVDILEPNDTGYSFAQFQDAIFGLTPDPEGTSTYMDCLLTGQPASSTKGGLQTTATSFSQGVAFSATFAVFNMGSTAYTGQSAVAHFAKDGTQKGLVSATNSWNNVARNSGFLFSPTCTITEAIEEGDYIAGIFIENSTESWLPIRAYDDSPWQILLMATPEEVAAGLHLIYSKSTNTLTFDAPMAIQYTVTRIDSGATIASGEVASFTEQSIDLSACTAGEYRFSFASGGRPYELIIEF